MPLGVPLGGFIYAASQGLQSVSCLLLQVEVLGLVASCILRAGFFLGRNWVGKYRGSRGHTLVSSPRVSSRFVESGKDSNLALKS
jgi:hypothetical protein